MHISIIVPTYGRSDNLPETIRALSEQDPMACDREILVVDNGPSRAIDGICNELRPLLKPYELRYVSEDIPGLLATRHRGASMAKGDVFTFLDDDVSPDPLWLSAISDAFESSSAEIVGGPNLPSFHDEPTWLNRFWIEDGEGRYNTWLSLLDLGPEKRKIDPNYVWGLNFSIRRDTFLQLQGFHPDAYPSSLDILRGDGESGLTRKAKIAGISASYVPAARVIHRVPRSRIEAGSFSRRAFLQGISDSYSHFRGGGVEMLHGQVVTRLRAFLPRRRRSSSGSSGEVVELTRSAFIRGYRWHQRQLKRHQWLRQWVRRPNYLDYRLPHNLITEDQP